MLYACKIKSKPMEDNNENNLYVKPDNHMALAIFTTICCCIPFGIIAIIKASKVNEYYILKMYDMAELTASESKKYSIIGIVIGVVIYVVYGVLNLIGLAFC